MSLQDELAQPNQKQKKPWHGITPGARFAGGGAVESYDDGGAIPEEGESYEPDVGVAAAAQDDNSGALPVAQSDTPDDNSGALPVADSQGSPQQEPQSRSGLDFNAAHVPGNAANIIKYLIGGTAGGGADPETAEKFARPDKHKGASDADANLLAVEKAYQLGGPDAAWQMVQFNRGAYNAKSAFAKAALTGVEGKAPDPQAAADAATKASAHLLDGSDVHYAWAGDGFVAFMKVPGSTQVQQIPLTPEQLAKVVDPSGEGQYDKVIEQGGIPGLLARIAKQREATQQGRQAEDDAAEARISGAEKADAEFQAAHPNGKGAFDENGHYLGPQPDEDPGNFGKELQRRSRLMFPGGNVTNEPARNAWMQEQEEKERERQSKIDAASEKGFSDVTKAGIAGTARVEASETSGNAKRDVQNTKSASYEKVADQQHRDRVAKLEQLGKIAQDSTYTKQERNAAGIIANKRNNNKPLTPEEEQVEKALIARAQAGADAQALIPQAARAPQVKTPTGQPQRQIGQRVTTQKGTFEWTGNGWKPVQ